MDLWSPLSLQNLLFRHQQPSGRPVPTQHCREGQPQLLLCPGERAALDLLRGFRQRVRSGGGDTEQVPCGGLSRPVCFQGYYPSNKPGVEPKRPCRPINLTHLMYLSSATNRITVTWGNYGKVSGP